MIHLMKQSVCESFRSGVEYFYEMIVKFLLFSVMALSFFLAFYFYRVKENEVALFEKKNQGTAALVNTAPELIQFLTVIILACSILFLVFLILGMLYLFFSEKQKRLKEADTISIKKFLGATDRQVKMEWIFPLMLNSLFSLTASVLVAYRIYSLLLTQLKTIFPL